MIKRGHRPPEQSRAIEDRPSNWSSSGARLKRTWALPFLSSGWF